MPIRRNRRRCICARAAENAAGLGRPALTAGCRVKPGNDGAPGHVSQHHVPADTCDSSRLSPDRLVHPSSSGRLIRVSFGKTGV
jgi:hypothetical protein